MGQRIQDVGAIETMKAYGTSEGVSKAWDSRGRGRAQRSLATSFRKSAAHYRQLAQGEKDSRAKERQKPEWYRQSSNAKYYQGQAQQHDKIAGLLEKGDHVGAAREAQKGRLNDEGSHAAKALNYRQRIQFADLVSSDNQRLGYGIGHDAVSERDAQEQHVPAGDRARYGD